MDFNFHFHLVDEALTRLTHSLEKIMSQQDRILAGVQANKEATQAVADSLDQLSTKVETEMQQLREAIEAEDQPSEEVEAALAALEASTAQLRGVADKAGQLGTQMDSDDPTTSPPASAR